MPDWGANVGGSGGYLNPADTLNNPIVVWVLQHVAQAGPTTRRPQGSDAIELDVIKLNPENPAASEVHRNQLWRTARIIGALKGFAGSPRPCLVMVYDEKPGDQTTRRIHFLASDQRAQDLANAWYGSLGESG